MLNRLPDRGSDTSRQVGDFKQAQEALGRASGWSRVGAYAVNYDGSQMIGVGHGHIEGVGVSESRSAEFQDAAAAMPFNAREGDMYN
jgi:hypothetical protein